MVVIAHLSDTHVDTGERSFERTGRVMRHLAALPTPVDVVVVTGDITHNGEPGEYERVRGLFETPTAVLVCPGNHDVREPFRQALLSEPPTGTPVNRSYRIGGVLFAMCDSTVPGAYHGLLADETLAWLDAELSAAADLPAFVCFHHPPVVLGAAYIDRIRQFGAERLAAVVGRHPNVVALLCGHAHTPAVTTFADRPLLIAPGVASTLLRPEESDEVVNLDLPPMLAFHLLDEDRRLVTHFRVVP